MIVAAPHGAADAAAQPHGAADVAAQPQDDASDASAGEDDDAAPTVDDLFTMPAPPLVQGPPVDEQTPIEEVLREYVKSITGPLPDYIIAALATLLDLDDDGKDKMTEALLQHAGDGIAELQDEQEALLARHA
ncbi:unnamed protein product [Urochloa humidicola]